MLSCPHFLIDELAICRRIMPLKQGMGKAPATGHMQMITYEYEDNSRSVNVYVKIFCTFNSFQKGKTSRVVAVRVNNETTHHSDLSI